MEANPKNIGRPPGRPSKCGVCGEAGHIAYAGQCPQDGLTAALRQERADERAAARHEQRLVDRKRHQAGEAALQALAALELARERHGCRGVLAPLPLTGRAAQFKCLDCRQTVSVSLMEAADRAI